MKKLIFSQIGLLPLFFLSCLTNSLIAQDTTRTGIRYDTNEKTASIFFVNGKVWNLAENNPYNQLDYPVLEYVYYTGLCKKYQVTPDTTFRESTTPIEKIDTFFVSLEHLPADEDRTVAYAQSRYHVTNSNKSYTAAYYILMSQNQDEDIIGMRSTIIVFDSLGNILRVFRQLDTAPIVVSVTEDGKYLGMTYGEMLDESGSFLANPGFRVYDISTGEKVFEIEGIPHEGEFSFPCLIGNNKIVVSYNFYPNGIIHSKHYIFSNGKVYTKLYNRKSDIILNIKDDGFEIESEGKIRKDLFERDFDVLKQ